MTIAPSTWRSPNSGRLAHVNDRPSRRRARERGRRHGPTGVPPGLEAAGDLAGERLVADAEGLTNETERRGLEGRVQGRRL
jgi:hypothetical protein